MIHRVGYIKDTLGNNYLGIDIQPEAVYPFLERLKNLLGDDYDDYIKNQQNRDHGKYHITLINVSEYNGLSSQMGIDNFINSLDKVFDFAVDDVKLLGIGKASNAGNTAYFVVVSSDDLQEVRKRYNLPEQDFHITLGFRHKDVFGARKNELLKETEPFLIKLKKSYLKDAETFEFIKEVRNFDFDIHKDIEPIKINDTTATFRCGDNDYFGISLIDNEFYITSKWQDTNRIPILSDVLISKKFKDI